MITTFVSPFFTSGLLGIVYPSLSRRWSLRTFSRHLTATAGARTYRTRTTCLRNYLLRNCWFFPHCLAMLTWRFFQFLFIFLALVRFFAFYAAVLLIIWSFVVGPVIRSTIWSIFLILKIRITPTSLWHIIRITKLFSTHTFI